MKGKLESNIDKNFERSSDLNKKQVYPPVNLNFRSIFKNRVIILPEDTIDYWNLTFKKKYDIIDSKKCNENLEKVVKTKSSDTNIFGMDNYLKTEPYEYDIIQFNKLTVLNSFLWQGVI